MTTDRDIQQKFLIESCDVRGQVVKLDATWMEAVARVDYPSAVKKVLGEAFASAVLLAGTIKFDGKMTLQIRGDGAVHLLVVQVTNTGTVRGLARWRETPVDSRLHSLFGTDARMSITIEASRSAEPYQGIVPLEGDSLAEALQLYFQISEQLPTQLFLTVGEQSIAGMLIQKLPADQRTAHDADGWQRAKVLGSTLSDDELCEELVVNLLHRIFHEEQVRVFDSEPVRFECSCSRERTSGMLLGLGEQEVKSIIREQGSVEITCEFCDHLYAYDPVDIAALFKGAIDDGQSTSVGSAGTGHDRTQLH